MELLESLNVIKPRCLPLSLKIILPLPEALDLSCKNFFLNKAC